jgi:hypothetical protein
LNFGWFIGAAQNLNLFFFLTGFPHREQPRPAVGDIEFLHFDLWFGLGTLSGSRPGFLAEGLGFGLFGLILNNCLFDLAPAHK